jgi:predicted metalloprotease with PDZ domain
MFLRVCLILVIVLSYSIAFPQSKGYQYTIDLTTVQNDRIQVDLIPPSIRENEITFYMPKIVPGTYAVADYGRFVADLRAVDKKGHPLQVHRLDHNSWRIQGANRISKISYWVDDTFDAPANGPEIFWPAGTNIEEKKNYLLNTGGFFGYLEGMKELPFQIRFIREKGLYGATGLIPVEIGKPLKESNRERSPSHANVVVDVYETPDYEELIDSPFMFSPPDTAIIRVGNTDVLVGSYSPNKRITAKQIASAIADVLEAQKHFLGGVLPVNKYAFLFYFTDQPVVEYGALEHSYSSVYYMPEVSIDEMNEELKEFAAHEFFHIVTPLTIHSEHIDNFDFNNPQMSQHLWMYEGVTEYFASLVMVKYGLMSHDEFLNSLVKKMHTSDQFLKDVPFTEISKYTIDKYHDQFYNVYQKGALIALCLDLKLLKLSKGKYGLQNMMLDLSKKFGKNKAFRDDELFEEITKLTYPEIGEFFNRYVKGIEVLPLQYLLAKVGVDYVEEKTFEDYSLGITSAEVGVTQHDDKPRLQVSSTDNQNTMGAALGLEEGDILIGINDEMLPDLGPELGQLLHKQHKALPELETLSYLVLRKNESGEWKEVKLSAPVVKVEMVKRHLIEFKIDANPEQLALRDAWLRP